MGVLRTRPGAGAGSRVAWLAAGLVFATAAGAAPSRVPGGIRFTYQDEYAQKVTWAGAFNGWNTNANPMTRGADGVWSIVLDLPAGAHEYKFVVDGQWVADPENPATAGEFGNSVIQVADDGGLVQAAATANTPYSAKILVGGRVIGLYQSIRSGARERFEFRRPDMDIDLNFGIRVSESLRARFLTNIRSETEDVELYRSRLNFDRGHLHFTQPGLDLFAYDNDDAGTWDDPLHLVGDVGIYRPAYGFGRQGFRVQTGGRWGTAEFHYADNFAPGTENIPLVVLTPDQALAAIAELPVRDAGGGDYVLAPGGSSKRSAVDHSDRNEDMAAARVQTQPLPRLSVGVLGRFDRGFNLGSIELFETRGPRTFRETFATFEQQWLAVGGEARWAFGPHAAIEAEYLRGVHRLNAINGIFFDWDATSIGEDGVTGIAATEIGGASEVVRDLDRSHRFLVGGRWTAGHGDIALRGALEYQSHDYRLELPGIDNSLRTWRFGWDRNWRYYLNRAVTTTLEVEVHDFDYDPRTPWGRQFWFAPSSAASGADLSSGNFWLEHDRHLVRFDRLALLGGEDVVTVRPRLHVPLAAARNVTFDYDGAFLTQRLGRLPKYAESIFRFGLDVTPYLRFSTDTRWVKYDDPLLSLCDGYVDHFAQFAYGFGPGVRIELSYGVDPYVLDPPVNEFAMIGRDQFLFDPDLAAANAATALTNYRSLAQRVAAAEKALRDERRVQVRGIVNF